MRKVFASQLHAMQRDFKKIISLKANGVDTSIGPKQLQALLRLH